MTINTRVGQVDIRKEAVDATVKGFATAMYKFKQAVSVVSTTAWKNFYFRESPTALSSAAQNPIKAIPRGSSFPQAKVTWEKISSTIEKYGLEDTIPWEDLLSDDIDVRDRTLFRIAEGVTKAVDDEIWDVLSESQSPTNIHSFTAANNWDTSSATIINDVEHIKQLIGENNYSTSGLMMFLSPSGHRFLLKYLTDKGAQFPSVAEGVMNNGKQGSILGLNLVVTNSITTSHALICAPQICGTWQSLVPLQTTTIEDPYKNLTIRATELGVTQLTDPKAVGLVTYG